MPLPAPIILNLYDPETQEITNTLSQAFVPWKMLKKGIALNKQLSTKDITEYNDDDADAITHYILSVFTQNGVTPEILEEQSDLTEMVTVLKAVMNRAKGVMDPTLPPKA